jgi:signal transduction histidine kinase
VQFSDVSDTVHYIDEKAENEVL